MMTHSLKAVVLVVTLAAPSANAQSCCAGSSQFYIGGCCSASNVCGVCEPTFVTTHKWKQTAPGVLSLDGTKFTIKFDPTEFVYVLWWGDKRVDAASALATVKQRGVERASDMQDAGVSLN